MTKMLTARRRSRSSSPPSLRAKCPSAACPACTSPSNPPAASLGRCGTGARAVTARLVLGTVFETANGAAELDQQPVVGGHLTLSAARRLAGELRHGVALGRDPGAVEKDRERTAFAQVARDFIAEHKVRKSGRPPRGVDQVARVLGSPTRRVA